MTLDGFDSYRSLSVRESPVLQISRIAWHSNHIPVREPGRMYHVMKQCCSVDQNLPHSVRLPLEVPLYSTLLVSFARGSLLCFQISGTLNLATAPVWIKRSMLSFQAHHLLPLRACLGLSGSILVRHQIGRPTDVGTLAHAPEASKTANHHKPIG